MRHLALVAVVLPIIGGCSGGDNLKELPLPPPTEAVEVTIKREVKLTSQARIPERDPSFESAVASADRVVLSFKAKPALEIAAGDVIAGTGATPYLRKVASVVSRSDTRIELSTEPAELTDLIVDGAFALRIAPGAATWDTEASPEVSGHQYALSTDLDLLKFMDSGNGFSCTPGLSIKPVLKPSFGFLVEVDIEPTFFPLGGELKYAKFAVDGGVQVGGELGVDASANITCTADLIAYLRSTRGEDFMRLKSHITTAIGPVPVEVTVFVDPVFKIDGQIGVTAKTRVNAVANVNLGVVAGVEYVDKQTKAIWQPTAAGSTQASFPELAGVEVSGSLKLSAGIKVGALLYDTAGPEVGVVGFLEDKITASTETCTWVATATAGIEASVGVKVQVPIIAKELLTISESFTLAEKQIASIDGELPLCTLDAGIDTMPDAGPDAMPDAGPDAMPDTGPDATADAGPDATADAGPDAAADSGSALATAVLFLSDRDGDTEIFGVTMQGTNLTKLTNNSAFEYEPVLSLDGQKIAFSSDRDGTLDIYTMNVDGSNLVNLTPGSVDDDYFPMWSADGTKIVFVSHRDGNAEIYAMNADGTNAQNLTNTTAADDSASFSPDGSKVLFRSRRDGNSEIYVMDANGTNPTNLSNSSAIDERPSWSPDGTKIVFQSNRTGNYDVFVMDADGSNLQNLTLDPAYDSVFLQAWSPDGTKILFGSDRGGDAEIYLMDTNGANPTNLTNTPGLDFAPLWTPDGSRISFETERDGNREIYLMDADGTNVVNVSNDPGYDSRFIG